MPLFGPIIGNDLTALEAIARPANFADGQTIFSQDAPTDAVYKIVSGVAKLDRLLPDGRRLVVGFALPGYFLGLSMYPTRNFGAHALGRLTALRFDLASFRNGVLDSPSLLKQVFELAGHQLDASHERMMTMGRKSAEERLAWFLIEFGEQWEQVNGVSEVIPLPMTRTDIADHLGLTIETVSRAITKLAREKVIVVEQHGVRVLDAPWLVSLAKRDVH